MDRQRISLVLMVVLLLAAQASYAAAADDQFLTSLSNIVTRTARKEVGEKKFDFELGKLAGHVQAIEPDERLTIQVEHFQLAGDLVQTSLTASGRVAVDANGGAEAALYMVVDVKIAITAEARFIKDGDRFYVAPIVKDLELSLSVLEVVPDSLHGSPELMATLAMAAINKNKPKILAEINQRIGKRAL